MPWPIYGSIGDAALDLGIPREILRWAKRNGCPGFGHKKVDARAFLNWWFDRFKTEAPAEAILDYQAERAARERAMRMLLEKKLELMNEDYVRWSEVERWIGLRVIQPLAQWMQSAPVAWCGHVRPDAPDKGREQLEAMIDSLRRLIDTMTASADELRAAGESDDEEDPESDDDDETTSSPADADPDTGQGVAGRNRRRVG